MGLYARLSKSILRAVGPKGGREGSAIVHSDGSAICIAVAALQCTPCTVVCRGKGFGHQEDCTIILEV